MVHVLVMQLGNNILIFLCFTISVCEDDGSYGLGHIHYLVTTFQNLKSGIFLKLILIIK